jgi:hypothetical protein
MLIEEHKPISTGPLASKRRPDILRPISTRKRSGTYLLLFLMLVGGLTAIHFAATGQVPLLHRQSVWSIATYDTDSPLRPPSDLTPSLTAADVSDVAAAFVADPFMLERNGQWYMFFEVLNNRSRHGDIGVAIREIDGSWKYQQIVLDEPFHLSYPNVFSWQDRVYMVPESEAAGEIRLYEAVEFPLRWQLRTTLVRRDAAADPTVFRSGDRWWMFVGRAGTHDELSLYMADHLEGPWSEHPQSPIVKSDRKGARPGGRVIMMEDRLLRFGQDCRARYGHQLFAFEIVTLTATDYAEVPALNTPFLQPMKSRWNNCGMHHGDLHATDDGRWIGSVDGHTKKWRFGLWPY